jgi:hypothetical protein
MTDVHFTHSADSSVVDTLMDLLFSLNTLQLITAQMHINNTIVPPLNRSTRSSLCLYVYQLSFFRKFLLF